MDADTNTKNTSKRETRRHDLCDGIDAPFLSKDDPAVRQCEAMLRYIRAAPDAATEKNRRAQVNDILRNWNNPDATIELIPASTVIPNPPQRTIDSDRALFEFAAGAANVIIGQYRPRPDDTPESRERSLRDFLAQCRELAPHAEVVVLMPSEKSHARWIDDSALVAAVRTYATVSRANAEKEARRERMRAKRESGVAV